MRVIESAADLSQDRRTIASLDKWEALVTSTFTKFAADQSAVISRFVRLEKERIYSGRIEIKMW